MKILKKLILTALLALSISANAQNEDNQWLISTGINAVDFFPVGEDNLGGYFDQYFNTAHYNVVPSLSYVSVNKYLEKGFSIGLGVSLNKIDKIGDTEVKDISYYGTEATILYNFLKNKTFDPFLGIGGSYTFLDNQGFGTMNGTAGFNVWFNENIGITINSSYKHDFENVTNKHFQHKVGIALRLGGKDSDKDGVYDKQDECPQEPGIEALNGCPDSDDDGIKDSEDNCPEVAGLEALNGCPDSDGDGVKDSEDSCPEVAGLKEFNGCIDSDGDGVSDNLDNCPDKAGSKDFNGCPDTDNDGVEDKKDKCPETFGTIENEGCPEVTEEVQNTLNEYAKTILFENGKNVIKPESKEVLTGIVTILNEYPSATFNVEGHTDSIGKAESNLKLSENRAKAVLDFLIKEGVDSSRLSSRGYGAEKPIDSNKTKAGRANNRRVEINLTK